MGDNVKRIEGKAYARGYAAGRARIEKEIDREIRREEQQRRFDTFLASALTGLLAHGQPWSRGEKTDKYPEDWVDTAADFARQMMARLP